MRRLSTPTVGSVSRDSPSLHCPVWSRKMDPVEDSSFLKEEADVVGGTIESGSEIGNVKVEEEVLSEFESSRVTRSKGKRKINSNRGRRVSESNSSVHVESDGEKPHACGICRKRF